MKRGDVLYWPDFKYKDGGAPTPKLIFVAGVDKYKDVLLYRTTSQSNGYRPDRDGCHSDDSVYRFKDNPKPFHMPTWVQFEEPYVKSVADIEARAIKVCFTLTEDQILATINCLRRSPEFAKWLIGYGV
jgi:hypothetical protein